MYGPMAFSSSKLPVAGWADRFFGPLYGEIYRRHLIRADRTRAEAAFAAKALQLKDRRVLDLAAGYGRHARILSRRNHVTALDLNAHYLVQAMQGYRGGKRGSLQAVAGDMRYLPCSTGCYDAVLLLFNSFGYFGSDGTGPSSAGTATAPAGQVWRLPDVFYQRDLVSPDFGTPKPAPTLQTEDAASPQKPTELGDAQVLQEISRVLRPGGDLLIEVPNPAPLIDAVTTMPRRHEVTAQYAIEEEYVFDPVTRLLRNRTRFRKGRREEDGEYTLRLYSRAELEALLIRHQLRPRHTWGDYSGARFNSRTSEMILLHARKT